MPHGKAILCHAPPPLPLHLMAVVSLPMQAPYLLALSLLLSSPEEWAAGRRAILSSVLRHAFAQHAARGAAAPPPPAAGTTIPPAASVGASVIGPTSGQAASGVAGAAAGTAGGAANLAGASDAALWAVVAPAVRFFGAVDLLQRRLKPANEVQYWTDKLRGRWAQFVHAQPTLCNAEMMAKGSSACHAFVHHPIASAGTTCLLLCCSLGDATQRCGPPILDMTGSCSQAFWGMHAGWRIWRA